MTSTAHGRTVDDTDRSSPRTWLVVTVVQTVVILVVGWLWSSVSSDASSTAIDLSYVALVIATPVVFALSGLLGQRARRRLSTGYRATRWFALATHCMTLGLLVLSGVFAPIGLLGALVFDRMG